MVELPSVLSDLRHQYGIAPGADVPRRLVAEAVTRRLLEQDRPDGDDTRTCVDPSDPASED